MTTSNSLSTDWTKIVGSTLGDGASGIAIGNDSSIYLIGSSEGSVNGLTDPKLLPGGINAFIAKYDLGGNTLWTRLIGTSISQIIPKSVTTQTTGDVYVVGAAVGTLDGQFYSGSGDAFIVKYDAAGSRLWSRLIGTNFGESGFAVSSHIDGGVVIGGTTSGNLYGQSFAGGEGSDGFVAKVNGDGTTLWTRLIGSTKDDNIYAIATEASGSIYVAGRTAASLDNQTYNGGFYDGFITKFDTNGVKLWTRLIGTSKEDGIEAITIAADGSIYVTGATYLSLDGQQIIGSRDAFVAKYNPDGVKIWTRLIGSVGQAVLGYGIENDANGNILVAGQTSGSIDGQPYGGGSSDVFITSLSNQGVRMWTRLIGASGDDYANGMVVGDDGSVFLNGTFTTNLNGQTSLGSSDVFIIKLSLLQAQTYSISANQTSINEGSTATFTVSTTNVASGTSLAYTLSGVSASDITGGSLSGTTTVGSNGQATISVPIAADQTTEGNETLTVTVQGKTASTTIVDTSTTPTGTYALAASSASVNEGGTASFILTTTNVAAGTSLAYTISGVSASDLFSNSLSGSVSVASGGTTVISIPVLADNLTEGTETMTVSLQGRSASVNILDTSTTPIPTYSISSNTSEVSEGSSFIVTLSTTNVAVGTIYPWAITSLNMTGRPSSADFDNGVTEGLVVVDNNGKAVVTLPVKADQLTEGYEDIYFSFYTDTTRTRVLANTAASIKDTSVGSATYSIVASSPTVSEGSSATFNIATTNVPTGTSLSYTITGVTASDLRDGLLTGSVVVGSNGQATVTVPIAADLTTEGNETLTVNLMGRTASVNIQDTSTDALRFTTPSLTVNEGDSVTVRVDALAVGIGPRIYYTIYGVSPEDFSQGTYGIDIDGGLIAGGGSGVNAFVNSGGTLTLPIANDQTTEGTETLTIRFSNGANGQSISFQILDTSKTPSYVITSNQSSVGEGSTASFSLSTTNVTAGSSIAYTLSGVSAADIVGGALSGNAVISSNGQATISVPIAADQVTEGTETLTVTVQGKTASTQILDTSLTPAGTYAISAKSASVNEGANAEFTVVTTNVSAGTQLTYNLSGTERVNLF